MGGAEGHGKSPLVLLDVNLDTVLQIHALLAEYMMLAYSLHNHTFLHWALSPVPRYVTVTPRSSLYLAQSESNAP